MHHICLCLNNSYSFAFKDKYEGFQCNGIVLWVRRHSLQNIPWLLKCFLFHSFSPKILWMFLCVFVTGWIWIGVWASEWVTEWVLVTTITIRFNKFPKYAIIFFTFGYDYVCEWFSFSFFPNSIFSHYIFFSLIATFPLWLHEWTDFNHELISTFIQERD